MKICGQKFLVAAEKVAGIDLVFDIIEDGVIAVGDDGIALLFELREIIDNTAAKEHRSVGKCGLVDNDNGTFGLDTFHHTLDATLTEIIGVGLHGETEHADGGGCKMRFCR